MNHPLVSVIIANYNKEKYLEACIRSVLAQSYENIEIVFIDDASTDGSCELIEALSKENSQIKLLKNSENIGVSAARDKAVAACGGDYITTLDSDDFFLSPKKIEAEMEQIKKHGERRIIAFSEILRVNEAGERLWCYREKPIAEGMIFEKMLTRSCMIPRDFLMHKACYYEAGGYDLELRTFEDWDLKLRLAMKYPFYSSNIEGIAYRIVSDGLSSKSAVETFSDVMNIFERYVPDNMDASDQKRLRHNVCRNIENRSSFHFSSVFNKIFDQLQELSSQNRRCIIYGAGKIGQMITALFPNIVVTTVDFASDRMYDPQNSADIKNRVFSLGSIAFLEYESIVISVLGRESEIIYTLLYDYNIDPKKIIVLKV